jgi:large subunit ribosomal protein L1
MHSKKYREVKTKAPGQAVGLTAAVAFLKEHARTSFDETVEVHVRLGVDATKSDQAVRGAVNLPAGLPKKPRIVVFVSDPKAQEAALKAGALQAGGEELVIDIVKEGALEADITVAAPEMMPRLAKAAKILGPKGLMPSPKAGTVTPAPAEAVEQLISGKTSFKMDQSGNIHAAIAKNSWDQAKIIANAEAFLEAVRNSRPAAAKGEFIRSVTLKTTMSPAVRVSG